jgi:HPt (histidine-containing phosphotransfer) domain-containing protein
VVDVLDKRVLDELRDSVGGDQAFLSELIDEFLNEAPRQLETLRAAAAAGDGETARRAAHTLKGNGRTFGATELTPLCQEAEAAAANGDLDGVRQRLAAIDAAWEQVRAALAAARKGEGQ